MAVSQFTVYKSTDGSAPVLTGAVGSLVALLDACLVNGYGAKAAAGWTKPFTGTNKAAFKNGTGSTGFYLRVQDDAPVTAKEARITGYETMSDVDTGTQPFPTAAQGVGGVAMVVARKSATADATARAWIVVADARTVYVFVFTTDTANSCYSFVFGDTYSVLSGDNYRCIIIGRALENSAASGSTSESLTLQSTDTAATIGHFMARSYTAIGASIVVSKSGDVHKSSNSVSLSGNLVYPNSSDSSIYLSPIWVCEITPLIRGRLRGLWQWLHVITGVSDGDTFSGTGDLAGRTFLIIKQFNAAASGVYVIETSNTVETN